MRRGKLFALFTTVLQVGSFLSAGEACCMAQSRHNLDVCEPEQTSSSRPSFALSGLTNPATVAETIFVSASAVPPGSSVNFCIDGVVRETENLAPYWLGGENNAVPQG